jgi:rsbT co-antagonist protein RsbR
MRQTDVRLSSVITDHEQSILNDWLTAQRAGGAIRKSLVDDAELGRQSHELLRSIAEAYARGAGPDLESSAWRSTRDLLSGLAQARARQGFTPMETASFILSMKQAVFNQLRQLEIPDDRRAGLIWESSQVMDRLALLTLEVFQKSRDEIIMRQQQEMLELSTPVVTLWKGILALPLIGTLDSHRTAIVMESLLQRIVETGSVIAILDITGVPTVDTLVAQHLLKTVAAARLMGADCIVSGIRPQIAQTIVHLGVDLNSVTTKATLADAFAIALRRLNLTVAPADGARGRLPAPAGPTPPGGAEDL